MNTEDALSKWRSETFYSKEPETLAWLDHFGSKITSLVDVGANLGLYSLYWLTLNAKNFSLACEPFLPNIQMLITNLELNNFRSRCDIVESPLSEVKQMVNPVIYDERIGASGFTIRSVSRLDTIRGVETTTLDDVLSRISGLCILKIDTDGTDFEILKGARLSLTQGKIVSILIESSERQQIEIAKFLNSYNFILDETLNYNKDHSDLRRIASGKIERNRIYSLKLSV
jgi:FkbM family methyltransferase